MQSLIILYFTKKLPKICKHYIKFKAFIPELGMGLLLKPEPGPSPAYIFEARFRPEAKFSE